MPRLSTCKNRGFLLLAVSPAGIAPEGIGQVNGQAAHQRGAAVALAAPTVTSAPSSATAPAPGRTRGVRQFHLERPAIDGLPVKALDRLSGILGRGHLDEAEAPRAAGVAIRHHC